MAGHQIGLSNLHVFKLTSDDVSGAKYAEPVAIPEIVSISIEPQNQSAKLYADNQSVDSANTVSEYKLSIEMAGLSLEHKAMLLGHSYDKGQTVAGKEDVSPFFAVAFECLKSNGKKRYMKFLKVQFQEPKENPKTKADKIEFNQPSMEGTAIYRSYDGNVYKAADEDEADLPVSVTADWYKSVDAAAASGAGA